MLKFSRIELLRGNADEAIRLNVREIEALQVHVCGLASERPASTDYNFRQQIFNRQIRELHLLTTGWKGCSRSTVFTGAVQVSTSSNLGSKILLKTIFSTKQRVWSADTLFIFFAISNLHGCKLYFLLSYCLEISLTLCAFLLHETQRNNAHSNLLFLNLKEISACHRLLIHIDVSEELGTNRKSASM